jgi:hypothetical protein
MTISMQNTKIRQTTVIQDWFRLVRNTIEKYGILEVSAVEAECRTINSRSYINEEK